MTKSYALGRLSNLFNALPRKSPLRLAVYTNLLDLATANDGLDTLQLARIDVEKWLREWDISSEEKSTFLKTLADAYEKSGELCVSRCLGTSALISATIEQ